MLPSPRLGDSLGQDNVLSDDDRDHRSDDGMPRSRPSATGRPHNEDSEDAVVRALRAQIKGLKEENSTLKNWASRLEIQLHRSHAEVDGDSAPADVMTAPWLEAPEELPPLLQAYDDRIEVLENEVGKQEELYATACDNVERMEGEIEELHAQLADATNRLVKQAEANPSSAAVAFAGGDALLEQRAELEEQLDLSLKECGLLQDQVAALTEENGTYAKQITERDQRLALITQRYQQAVAAVTKLQEECKRLMLDKQTCETKVLRQGAVIAESKRAHDKMMEEVKVARDKLATAGQREEELKNAVAELQGKMNSDKDVLDDQIKTATGQARRLQMMLNTRTDELERLKSEHVGVVRERDEVKADAQNMLQVMQAYEKQLHEYTSREAGIEQLEQEVTERVEEAMLERDQAQAKETQSRREIARLLERRKVEAAEALRQQTVAVKNVRARLEAQLNDRDRQLKELCMKCTELQSLADRYCRDKQTAERETEALMEAAQREQGTLNAEVDRIIERMRGVETERDGLLVSLREAQAEAADRVRIWGIERQSYEEQQQEAEQRVDELAAELETQQGKVEQSQVAIKDLETQLREQKQQGSKAASRLQQQLEHSAQEKRDMQDEHARSTRDMQVALQESTDRIAHLQASIDSLRQSFRSETKTNNDRFSRTIQELTEDRNRLASRNEELLAQLTAVTSQREELLVMRQEMDNKLQMMHSRVLDAEKRASTGAAQLSQAFSEQERRLKELQTARADVDRAQLAEARILRRQRQTETRLGELQQQYEQLQNFTVTGGSPMRRLADQEAAPGGSTRHTLAHPATPVAAAT